MLVAAAIAPAGGTIQLDDGALVTQGKTPHTPNLLWLGIALALVYWLLESVIDGFVFERGTLDVTLVGEGDPNELWMRIITALMFIAFGWGGERLLWMERQSRFNSQRLSDLLGYVGQIGRKLPTAGQTDAAMSPALFTAGSVATADAAPIPIEDIAITDDEIGRLTRVLQDLSSFVDERFNELHALLELTRDINMGLLLDEVLDQAYITLRSVLPYDRLSVALLESDSRVLRARWARADYPEIMLRRGYARLMKGSSLVEVMSSREPRIINDLPAYLDTHPLSNSTSLMVAEGIRSSLTCPLIATGRPIGFMFFSSADKNTYRHMHVDIFKLIAGHLSVVVEKSNLFQQVLSEKEKSERLLLNVVPARIAARLGAGAQTVAENFPDVSILFADIESFTGFASRYPPEQVLHVLHNIFAPFDRLCELYGVEKVKTSGDEYMAMSTVQDADDHHLRRLAEYSLEAMRSIEGMRYPDGQPVKIRIGLHTGPAVAGVIGQMKFAYDVWGDAVNVASRMQSSGQPGRIHVSAEVYARLRHEFRFEERGVIDVRGKGPMKTYFMLDGKQRPARTLH